MLPFSGWGWQRFLAGLSTFTARAHCTVFLKLAFSLLYHFGFFYFNYTGHLFRLAALCTLYTNFTDYSRRSYRLSFYIRHLPPILAELFRLPKFFHCLRLSLVFLFYCCERKFYLSKTLFALTVFMNEKLPC